MQKPENVLEKYQKDGKTKQKEIIFRQFEQLNIYANE